MEEAAKNPTEDGIRNIFLFLIFIYFLLYILQ